jgi:hypothetical protein
MWDQLENMCGSMLIKVGAKITLANKATWEPNEDNNEE